MVAITTHSGEARGFPKWFAASTTVAVALLAAWAVLAVPYLPTNDGPQHIFSGFVRNHYASPGFAYRDVFVLQSQFAEKGFALLFAPLEWAFGWRRATQLCLVAMVEIAGFASMFAAASVAPARRPAGLLGFALGFTWPLYMGFFAFTVSSAVGLVTLGLALRRRPGDDRIALFAGVLLASQAFLHVVACAITGLMLVSIGVAKVRAASRAAWLREGVIVAATAVVPLAVFAFAASRHSDLEFADIPMRWVAPAERLHTLARLAVPGDHGRAAVAITFVLGAYAFAFARGMGRTLSDAELGIVVASTLFVLIGVFGPIDVPGWQFFGPRWLVLPVLLAPSLLPLERFAGATQSTRVAVRGAVVGLTLASLVLTARFHRRLWAGCEPVYGALDEGVRAVRFELPFVLDATCGVAEDPSSSEVPYLNPLSHVGALFATAHGAVEPYVFVGSSSTYAIAPRLDGIRMPMFPTRAQVGVAQTDEFRATPSFRHEVLAALVLYGRPFGRLILVTSNTTDVDEVLRAGYREEVHAPAILMARFHGCGATLRLPAGAKPLRVEYGVPSVQAAVEERIVEPSDERNVVLDGLVCGPGWLRVTDPETGASAACAGADATGSLPIDVAEGSSFTCDSGGKPD